MTDEELCKALRWKAGVYAKRAADRIEALVKERDEIVDAIAIKGGTIHAPTQDAYDSACRAIEKHRSRAEAAEALIADCADYLKEGETPRQRMDRDHRDVLALMDLLAKEKVKRKAAEAALKEAVDTINNLRELNTTAEDENGHRWANSDMAEQEIVAFLTKHGSQK